MYNFYPMSKNLIAGFFLSTILLFRRPKNQKISHPESKVLQTITTVPCSVLFANITKVV